VSRRLRHLRLPAAVLLLLAGLGFGAYGYLHSGAFRQRLENYVVAQLEQGSGARVEVGGMRLSLHPLVIELDDLVLHGREPAGQPPLAAIPRLVVAIRLDSLWQRQLSLQDVAMLQPRFHVYRLADGAVNLPQPSAPWPRRQQEARTLFDLGAQRLEIAGGELDLEDRRIPLNLRLHGVGLRLDATTTPGGPGQTPAGAAFVGALNFQQSAVRYGALPAVAVATHLRFTLWPNDLRLDRVELDGAGAKIEGQGWLRHFDHPAFAASYAGDLDLAAAARALGLRPETPAGRVVASGQAQWTPAGWSGAGTLRLAQGRWTPAPGVWSGAAAWQASGAGLVVSRLELDGLGSRLQLAARDDQWRGLALQGTVTRLQLAALQPLLGSLGVAAPWRQDLAALEGEVSGSVQATTNRDLQIQQVAARLTLTPGTDAGGLGVGGSLAGQFLAAPGELRLSRLDLQVAGSRLTASGTANPQGGALQLAFRSPDLKALRPLALPWAAQGAPGRALPPFAGSAQFVGSLQGAWAAPTVAGRLLLAQFRFDGESGDALTAVGRLAPDRLALAELSLRQGAQQIQISGSAGLRHYRLAPDSQLALEGRAQGVSLARVQQWAGVQYPLTGTLSAQAALRGTWARPQGQGHLALVDTRWRDQAVQSVAADFRLQNQQLSSSNLVVALAKTRIHGSFQLGLEDHSYRVNVSSNSVQLGEIALLQSRRLALAGQVRFQLDGSGRWDQPQGELVLTTSGLRGGGESLGDLGAHLQLAQGQLKFQAADILTNGSFNLTGTLGTAAPYAVDARLQLRDYDFDAWLRRFTQAQLSGHSRISGSATLQGPLAQPNQLTARIVLNPVELALSGLVIHNQGPVEFEAAQRRLTLLPAHLVAEDTDFTLQGDARLGPDLEAPARLQGTLAGRINLALLQSLHPATRAAGTVQVSAQLAGTTAQPQWRGQIAIENASLAEQGLPIGFDNIQGQLQLAGSRVQIVRLSAHTGGGTLDLTGFAAHSAAGLNFDVQAQGQNLRLRYRGISTTGDLQLRLSGQPGAALLAGDAQLNRVGLDRNFDLALFIASTQATPAPPNPDSVLNHIHMDIHLVTGPQVVVATNLAHLQLQADLHLRGTLAEPAVLGRANASEGRLLFAGNEYQVTKAQVQFVNPFRIEPLLDVGLSTTVQQYDVTLNLAGPADKLAITYRSDPPLSSSDVMALLATGQPTQATSTLSGASNFAPSEQLLGQALDNLVAGRLQRLFGITQVQVNPDTGALGTTGSGGTVTVQQQVSRNLKLTYTQNLSSSSQDIIQVDWTISRFLGITLSRDQFGLYGLKFTFRHRAR